MARLLLPTAFSFSLVPPHEADNCMISRSTFTEYLVGKTCLGMAASPEAATGKDPVRWESPGQGHDPARPAPMFPHLSSNPYFGKYKRWGYGGQDSPVRAPISEHACDAAGKMGEE
ncbi:uncharacterized protein PG986_010074 [Apiospora aurea]|uniref:Uncharacterized protein n=1 Tax=Apiospora aurea TaxID=335848 RepID=A0ABR1Q9G5_9PEZI